MALGTHGDAGKTYTLVRWLPSLRISGEARPHTTVREDAITIAIAGFALVALFWDGLRHNNLTGVDNFFSPPHLALYAGLGGLGIWIAVLLLRYQKNHQVLDYSAVPAGYTLAIAALPLAAIAGPADFMWHEAYGFENQIDSTFSPPHQGLFIAGGLLAAIPLAAAWQRRGTTPRSLTEFLPVAFSMSSIVAVALFIVHQMVPFYAGQSMTQDFQDDIAGRADAFAPGADAVHSEGLAEALTHYGDEAFPFYFYSTHHTIGGILLFTAVLMAGVLMLRRRWEVPVGTLTVLCSFLALLWPMLSEYRQAELIPALVLAGLAGDVLLHRLAGPGPLHTGKLRLFAALMPVVLWSLLFICVALFQGGLGWGPTLWVGVLVTSAALAYALSLLIFQPRFGPAEDEPRQQATAG